MSTTPNLGLALPAHGSVNWDTPLNNNFTTIDGLGGGTAGQVLTSNGPSTTPAFKALSIPLNAQTGTSYPIVDGDRGKWITLANGSAIAVALPQAGAGSQFVAGWFCIVQATGAGTVTVTPTTSTINGGATITRTTSQAAIIFSDGTNYHALMSA